MVTATQSTPLAKLTARDLLARLAPFGPAVEGGELVLASDPPADLLAVLRVLHTGVRAALSGRAWWGSTSDGKPRVFELPTDAPVPVGVSLLCAAGDARWDRVPPAARLDLSHLFAVAVVGSSRGPRKSGSHRERAHSETE